VFSLDFRRGRQAARGETRFNLAQLGSRCKQKPLTQKPELHTQLQNTHGFSLQGCWNTKFDSGNFARMNSNCSEIFSLNCGICESLGVRHWWSGRLEGWAHRRLWNVSSLAYYLSLCHCFCLISPRFPTDFVLAFRVNWKSPTSTEGEEKTKARIKFLRVLKNSLLGEFV